MNIKADLIKPLLIVTAFLLPLYSTADLQRPNVVFFLVDDLGWGDFGFNGARFYETPNIDRLASEGMRFNNGYAACTVCSPSRAAILSGRYPARLKLTDWITGHQRPYAKLSVPEWNTRVPHERVLLPEAFKEAGYETIFLGKWHLMPIGQSDFDAHYPTSHGFDLNIGGREWGQPKGRGKYFSPFDMPNLDDGEPGDFLTDKLTDAAINYLEGVEQETPFFIYFSYYTLHGPLMAPPKLVEKYTKKAKGFENDHNEFLDPRRAGMVEKLDESIGRVLEKLEAMGIADNTIIVLTGDNGGDQDETTAGLKGFKGFSHEGGVREPFVVKWPGKTKPGSACDVPVMGTDFYPTLLEMAGLKQKPDEHADGLSIVPLLTGEKQDIGRKNLYWHYPHYHRTMPYGAIRSGNWKLIEFFEDETLELYNLSKDPNETNNLAKQYPEKAQELLAEMNVWRQSIGAQMMTPNPNYDPKKAARRGKKKL